MAWSAAIAVVGGIAGAAMNKPPKLPPPTPPPPPPQEAKSPTAVDFRTGVMGSGNSGGSPGASSTLLTGPNGVDPAELKLGKSTLLGGDNMTGGG